MATKARTGSETPRFFSEAWWDLFIDAWNASSYHASLARFGLAAFAVTESGAAPVWVNWDGDGRAERRSHGPYDCPTFSAPLANWQAFVDGEFTAAMGGMRLKIRFRGPVRRVLPYLSALNNLARVARGLG